MRSSILTFVFLACAGCGESSAPGNTATEQVDDELSVTEVGLVPRPPGHSGRDVGFSAVLQGRSVWIFGDTFLSRKASDGLRWRSSSWSWTTVLPASGGPGEFEHALDSDGLARQLLPHTREEASFNLAHEGRNDCVAKTACGSRLTPWPQAIVTDAAEETAVVYYLNMQTGPEGMWDFQSVSASIAIWNDPDEPATRVEPPIFGSGEPRWGAAAVRTDEHIVVFACEFDGEKKPCLVGRVPFQSAADRSQYRFWNGVDEWSLDWRDAKPVFDGGSLFSVHYNDYLEKYVAFFIPRIDGNFAMRTADQPQGPWSAPRTIGRGVTPSENWNYALIAHPEFAREGGRIEMLSYTSPSGFLRQDIRLVEVRLDQQP